MELIMGINTNSFENYKNTVEVSEKSGFLNKIKRFVFCRLSHSVNDAEIRSAQNRK